VFDDGFVVFAMFAVCLHLDDGFAVHLDDGFAVFFAFG